MIAEIESGLIPHLLVPRTTTAGAFHSLWIVANVVISLSEADRQNHAMAMKWFNTPGLDWGLCAFTEAGFLRASANPTAGKLVMEQSASLLASLPCQPGYPNSTDRILAPRWLFGEAATRQADNRWGSKRPLNGSLPLTRQQQLAKYGSTRTFPRVTTHFPKTVSNERGVSMKPHSPILRSE